MAKSAAAPQNPESYEQVAARLEAVVRELEGGQLGLEESLSRFEEGIRLVRKGESRLDEAERRIAQLLSPDGTTLTPLEAAAPRNELAARAEAPAPEAARRAAPKGRAAAPADEDIPF